MDEKQAEAVAQTLGGVPWNSGGDIWLVLCERSDGRLTVISDEAVCEYKNREAFDQGQASATILLH
jgi:hypothetical protein